MISRDRFELALERLKSGDWERFERLASAFLAPDFPALRTVASTSGDRGRDGELFHEEETPQVVFQYSIQEKWERKVKETLERLKVTFPDVSIIYYVTNQKIGAAGDKLKREARQFGVSLDIMDRSWFLDRSNLDTQRAIAAEELARIIVDPILSSRGLIPQESSPLSSKEASTALVFLELQRADEVAGRNLTRSCFDALVRAALQGSSSSAKITRSAIYSSVGEFLPQHRLEMLRPYVDAALERLKKRAVTEWKKDDSFHINFHEAERVREVATRLLVLRGAFESEIIEIVDLSGGVKVADLPRFITVVKNVIEAYFLRQGEQFASAVARDAPPPVNDPDLKQIAKQQPALEGVSGRDAASFVLYVTTTLLTSPSASTLKYLKLLADSYTLFSFLRETPDVQAVTKKFSYTGISGSIQVCSCLSSSRAFPW